jgi:hypothetical protein
MQGRSPTFLIAAAGLAVIAAGLVASLVLADSRKEAASSAPAGDPTVGWVVVPTPTAGSIPAVAASPIERATPGEAAEAVATEPIVAAPMAAQPPVPPSDPDDEAPWPLHSTGIQAAMRAHLDEIKECYEGWLLEVPDLAGEVVVQVDLTGAAGDATATVASAHVESDLQHEAMDACVLNVVEGIPFEPPPDGTRVTFTYPFVFDTE